MFRSVAMEDSVSKELIHKTETDKALGEEEKSAEDEEADLAAENGSAEPGAAGTEHKRSKLELECLEKSKVGANDVGTGSEKINPMLVELVLSKIFRYFNGSLVNMKSFRLVCKTWEKEIMKHFRSRGQMDISHLIYPYTGADQQQQQPFVYDCIPPFENIRLRGCCKTLQNPNMIEWFEKYGSTIKRLRFGSSLACYHQTRFLECIMKLWCENLESLALDGVNSFTTFNHFSRFEVTPFICQLTEVIVNGESEALHNTKDCENNLELTFLNFGGPRTNRFRRKGVYWNEHDALFVDILQRVAQDADDPGILGAIEHIDREFGTDGGVFGHILQNNGVERVEVNNLLKRNFFLNALARKPKSISTLRNVEFGNFQMFLWEDHFQALQNLRIHLTKIVMGSLMTHMSSEWISRLLTSYKDSLRHLEFSGNIVLWDLEEEEEREFINIDIPLLPNLTTFINGNIFCTRLSGLDFMKNLPMLERCSLANAISHSSIFPLNPSQVFNLLFQVSAFDNQPHGLKELHLDGKITFSRHLEMTREWFPQLKKVELTLEGSDVFVEFFQIMKKSELEDVKLYFYSNDNEWCNAGIANNIIHMTKLKFLELIHLADHPLIIHANTCSNGFSRAPLLTSLKLDNFGMFIDEVQEIRGSLSRICYVKFQNCVFQYRPAQVEFSVCRIEIPHEIEMQM